jgi:DNA-binding CsgD family transcriptional regulator
MRATASVGAGARVLRQAGEVIGLPRVAVVHDISLPHGPNDEEGAKLADIFGWPDDYTAHWETRGNTFHDPVSLRCRSEHLPFYWPGPPATRRRSREGLPSSRSARVTRELGALGLHAAFIVPVHLPRGRVAVVGWWGPAKSASEQEALGDLASAPLFMLGHYFLDLLRARVPGAAGASAMAELSAREIECLTLAARGLTDGEMAARVGVSAHTVRFHLINAAEKLHARNRTHAVAMAAQLGMIGPVDEAAKTTQIAKLADGLASAAKTRTDR